MDRSLSASFSLFHLMFVFFYVFMWTGTPFCIPLSLFFLPLLLYELNWEDPPPSLFFFFFFWLVSCCIWCLLTGYFCSLLVMWCAPDSLYVFRFFLCVFRNYDVFFFALCSNDEYAAKFTFFSLISFRSNVIVLDFFRNAFALKNVIFFILRADGCIVCV